MNEAELVAQCLAGEAKAQQELYNRFAPRMMSVCLRYAENREEAEDFLQDGFIKVFTKLSSFKFEGSLEGWMRRVLVNNMLDELRRKLQMPGMDVIDARFNDPPSASLPTDGIQAKELMTLIASLPAGYRTIFNMYVLDGYSHKEIAAQLKIAESTSKSQLSRAREYLQKRIKATVVSSINK
ncbi:MAG: sigma-70 family RNA polymerase sigma factor [Bacteroidetes bacterium]|nr:sigma-70 family RNA polymerase sigma factor [Bacteroidota bacterium]